VITPRVRRVITWTVNMVWPFQKQTVTLDDIYTQFSQLLTIQRENAVVSNVIAKNCVKLANDSAAIRRLLWRLAVKPSVFEVVSEGEKMGYMNKRIVLPPVKDDVVRQELRIEAAGKTPVTATLDNAAGQSVGFSVKEDTEITISLQYFDNVGNPSTTRTRTLVVVDDVPPDGPDELQTIVSDSETAEPVYSALEDIPVEEPPVEEPPVEEPPVEEPPVEEPPVEEPPVGPTGPTGPVVPTGPTE
jgi:hypothetical protein